MRIQDLFRRRRPPSEPPAPPRCPCGRPGHAPICDDGPPVCPALLYECGDVVRRPDQFPEGTLAMLQEVHGDVVELVEYRHPKGRVRVWLWTLDEQGAIA